MSEERRSKYYNYTEEDHINLETMILNSINKTVSEATKNIHSEIYDSCSKWLFEHVMNSEVEIEYAFRNWLSNGVALKTTLNMFDGREIRKVIYQENKEEIENLLIKDLQNEVEQLKHQLQKSYERRIY